MRAFFRAMCASLGTALLVLVAQLWGEGAFLPGGKNRAAVLSAPRDVVRPAFVGRAERNRTRQSQQQTVKDGGNLTRSTNGSDLLRMGLAGDDAPQQPQPMPPAQEEKVSDAKTSDDESLAREPPTLLPLLPLRTCSQGSFPIPNMNNAPFVIEYQCNGTEYDNFTSQLHQLASDISATQKSKTWGRRPEPLPPNASVLFLGNSHTKQTAHEYVCQYADQVESVGHYHRSTTVFRFQNMASIYLVYKSPVDAALDWTGQLESLVRRPLGSFQAVVLGQFNGAGPDVRNSNYYRQMMNWSESDSGLQFGKVAPPDVVQVAGAFRGPVVFASNYDVGKAESSKLILQTIEDIKLRTNRTNLAGVLARKYVSALGGNECGTETRNGVGDCGRFWAASHRCVGPNGGHPTLIAHDVQELLYSFLVGREVK